MVSVLKVNSIQPSLGHIVYIISTSNAAKAFLMLLQHKLSSLPVFDAQRKRYVGFIGTADFLSLFIMKYPIICNKKNINILKLFQNTHVQDMMDSHNRLAYQSVQLHTPVKEALNIVVGYRTHKLPVEDDCGQLIALVTHGNFIKQFSKDIEKFSFSQDTISSRKLGYKNIISINKNRPAIEAFKKLDDLV